jgi:hypothetical protein
VRLWNSPERRFYWVLFLLLQGSFLRSTRSGLYIALSKLPELVSFFIQAMYERA